MSTFNYTPIANTVSRLIAKFGRTMTLVKNDRAAVDPTKPWLGPAEVAPTPNATTGKQSLSLEGVVVDPFDVSEFGFMSVDRVETMSRRGEKIILFAALDAPNHDLGDFDLVQDGTKVWKVNEVHDLTPGDTALLYGAEVSQ